MAAPTVDPNPEMDPSSPPLHTQHLTRPLDMKSFPLLPLLLLPALLLASDEAPPQQQQQQQSLSSCIGSAVSLGIAPQILDGTSSHECPTDASWVVAARMDNTTGNVYYITWSYIFTAEGQSIRSQVRLNSSDGSCTVIAGTGTYTPILSGSPPTSCITPTEPYCLMLPTSLLLDEARSALFIADNYNSRVLKFSTLDGTLSTVAGGAPGVLLNPVSLAMDDTGALVILDAGSGSIKRVVTTASGAITPVVTAHPQLFGAGGVAVMKDGNYAVAATQAGLVLKVNPSNGAVSKFAGQGLLSTTSYWDNLCPLLPAPPSTALPTTPVCFFLPTSITVDPSGNVIVSDVTFSADYATVFSQVRSLAFDTGAVLAVYPFRAFPLLATYASSAYIPPNFLNQSYTYFPCDVWALPGDVLASYATAATAAAAASNGGATMVVPPSGTILASTWDGGQVVLLPPTSPSPPPKLLTLTVPLKYGGDGGAAKSASLNKPTGMQYDPPSSTLYIADAGNHRIRMVGPTGLIQTIAGSNKGALITSYGTTYMDCSGVSDAGAVGTSACLSAPVAVALSPPPDPTCSAYSPLGRGAAGGGGLPVGDLYILEAGSGGVFLNLNLNERAAGAVPGVIPGRLRVLRGGGVSGVMRTLYTGGRAPPLTMFAPISMAFDACDGALFVAEQFLGVIYRFPGSLLLQSAASPGLPLAQFIIAGMPNAGLVFGDNTLNSPLYTSAAITAPLQLYLGGNSSSSSSSTGSGGAIGPTGLVISRTLQPGRVSVFFIDSYSKFVRCLTAAVVNSTGVLGPFSVTTVAGYGGGAVKGEGGYDPTAFSAAVDPGSVDALSARIMPYPSSGLALLPSPGRPTAPPTTLLLADTGNAVLRAISLKDFSSSPPSFATISTLSGINVEGNPTYSPMGDGGLPSAAALTPVGLAVDSSTGNIYISDSQVAMNVRVIIQGGTSFTCPKGFRCPCATSIPCTDPSSFCPANSVKATRTLPGYYAVNDSSSSSSSTTTTATTTLVGGGYYKQSKCPPGSYCVGGVKRPCPAGTVGDTADHRVSIASCSPCEPNTYNPTPGKGGDPKLLCLPCPALSWSESGASFCKWYTVINPGGGVEGEAGGTTPSAVTGVGVGGLAALEVPPSPNITCVAGTYGFPGPWGGCLPTSGGKYVTDDTGNGITAQFPPTTHPLPKEGVDTSQRLHYLVAIPLAMGLAAPVFAGLCAWALLPPRWTARRWAFTALRALDQVGDWKVGAGVLGSPVHWQGTELGGGLSCAAVAAIVGLCTVCIINYCGPENQVSVAYVQPTRASDLEEFNSFPFLSLPAPLPAMPSIAQGFQLQAALMGPDCRNFTSRAPYSLAEGELLHSVALIPGYNNLTNPAAAAAAAAAAANASKSTSVAAPFSTPPTASLLYIHTFKCTTCTFGAFSAIRLTFPGTCHSVALLASAVSAQGAVTAAAFKAEPKVGTFLAGVSVTITPSLEVISDKFIPTQPYQRRGYQFTSSSIATTTQPTIPDSLLVQINLPAAATYSGKESTRKFILLDAFFQLLATLAVGVFTTFFFMFTFERFKRWTLWEALRGTLGLTILPHWTYFLFTHTSLEGVTGKVPEGEGVGKGHARVASITDVETRNSGGGGDGGDGRSMGEPHPPSSPAAAAASAAASAAPFRFSMDATTTSAPPPPLDMGGRDGDSSFPSPSSPSSSSSSSSIVGEGGSLPPTLSLPSSDLQLREAPPSSPMANLNVAQSKRFSSPTADAAAAASAAAADNGSSKRGLWGGNWGGTTTAAASTRRLPTKGSWITHHDNASGRYYYENEGTGEVTWDKPLSLNVSPPHHHQSGGGGGSGASSRKLKRPWVEHTDPGSGKKYYENTQTGAVTWVFPV